jgi:hypothetical protein
LTFRLQIHLDSAPDTKHTGIFENQKRTLAAGHPRGRRMTGSAFTAMDVVWDSRRHYYLTWGGV